MESTKPKSFPRYRGAQNTSRSFRGNPSHFNSRSRQTLDSSETIQFSDADRYLESSDYVPDTRNYDRNESASNFNRTSESTQRKQFNKKKYNKYDHGINEQFQTNSNYSNYRTPYCSKETLETVKVTKSDQKSDFNELPEELPSGSIVGGRYIRKKHNQYAPARQQYNEQKFYSSKNGASYVNVDEQNIRTNYHSSAPDLPIFQQYIGNRYDKNTHFYGNSEHENVYRNREQIASSDNSKLQDQISPFHDRKKFNGSKDTNSRRMNLSDDVKSTNFTRNSTENRKFRAENIPNSKNYRIHAKMENYKDDATQRERLTHQLYKGECECLVCCDAIRVKDQIWHCLSCFHVFHLRCIRKWARSPAAIMEDGEWRCPACQNLTKQIPFVYYCFCGKHKDPEVDYHSTPHSCGEICGRQRGEECPHRCNLLCHPGPCPPCSAVLQKSCACGKTVKSIPCNQTVDATCDLICEKKLNCGIHKCPNVCHVGLCSPCPVKIPQRCFCEKSERQVSCQKDTINCENYCCGEICEKQLNCGQHKCDLLCHSGACNPCSLLPGFVVTCPCKKSSLQELVASGKCTERKSCLDPIPVCGQKCMKTLVCGPKENPHLCDSNCHIESCPPCKLSTALKCRCGSFTKEFPCVNITSSFVYLCEKRCNRRKDCGRHKCLNNCCMNIEHRCELICNKKLSCGIHHCQETCHMGKCPTCWNVSFDELHCRCGASVLFPPIHCGTKPPECSKPCTRIHPCDHKVQHNCHSEETCPPCTFLVNKWCFGHHKQCGNVQCFLDGISCGMPCLKPLPCGNHKCQSTCHSGPCLKSEAKCVQPCAIPRPSCGHPCGVTCHDGPCPETACKSQVSLTCPCGLRSEVTTCSDSTKSYRLMSVTVLASKMQDIKEGQSVNIGDVFGKKSKNNRLQCNEECAVIERNKRLAIALQIQNPELSCSPGPPNYSEFLKDETRKNPVFVSDVYDKISVLVQLAKQSKQKCRSHSFPPMNRDQRRIVHELAEFFGCETQSYDEEPKKNVVVTAYKNKCWLPFASVMTIVQRDMGIRLGIRKGPTPVPLQRESKSTTDANLAAAAAPNQKKKIDYFDYNQ